MSVKPSPVQCSNGYEALADATIKSPPQEQSDNEECERLPLSKENNRVETPKTRRNKKARRNARRLQKKMERLQLNADEDAFFTNCIEQAEDERTETAQQDQNNIWRQAEEQHAQPQSQVKLSKH